MESSVHVAEVTIHKNQKVSVLVILLLSILKKRERKKIHVRYKHCRFYKWPTALIHTSPMLLCTWTHVSNAVVSHWANAMRLPLVLPAKEMEIF